MAVAKEKPRVESFLERYQSTLWVAFIPLITAGVWNLVIQGGQQVVINENVAKVLKQNSDDIVELRKEHAADTAEIKKKLHEQELLLHDYYNGRAPKRGNSNYRNFPIIPNKSPGDRRGIRVEIVS